MGETEETYEAPPEAGPDAAFEPASNGTDTLYTAFLESSDSAAAPSLIGEVTIVAEEIDEPLELVVRGRGLTPGEHGWHVHAGPCSTPGAVAVPLSETATEDGITGPLDVNDDGEFEETVEVPDLSRTMVGSQSHSLHIHRNPGAEHGATVACATI